MAEMHPSMVRLYAAAALGESDRVRQVDIANALNTSSQSVLNWETRGISKDGALDAQRLLRISATYLLDGTGPEFIQQSQPTRITPEIMASAWRTASLVSAQTTGSATLSMPRDADLVAEALNTVIAEQETGGGDGEGVGTLGGRGKPSRAAAVGEEGRAARGRKGLASAGGPKRARTGSS